MNKVNEYIEKLNIVMTYPVNWSNFTVMENYLQNFFDAIGYKDFGKKFRYEYDEEQKTLIMYSEVGFDIKYLCGLGLSTKRNTKDYYAGKFGEGFKMAALCSYRDLKYEVIMQSQNWRLTVTESEGYIEKAQVDFLAYKVEIFDENMDTKLILKNVSKDDFSNFKYKIKTFFYLENEVFGKTICITDEFAVFYSIDKDSRYPGELFISLQSRKRLRFPIIFCNHSYHIDEDSRDRLSIKYKDYYQAIIEIIDQMPPDKLLIILENMRNYWGLHCNNDEDYFENQNMRDIVYHLIDIISSDKKTRSKFKKKYGDKLIADSYVPYNEKRMVEAWYLSSDLCKCRRRVINYFTKLGIDDIYTICKENDGLVTERSLNMREAACLSVLEKCGEEFFSDIYCYEKLPKCKAIKDYAGPVQGLACVGKPKIKRQNSYGLKIKGEIYTIKLQESLFENEKFSDALVVYLHELLHQFGGDSSIQFRKALFLMNERMIISGKEIIKYKNEWENCFGEQRIHN